MSRMGVGLEYHYFGDDGRDVVCGRRGQPEQDGIGGVQSHAITASFDFTFLSEREIIQKGAPIARSALLLFLIREWRRTVFSVPRWMRGRTYGATRQRTPYQRKWYVNV